MQRDLNKLITIKNNQIMNTLQKTTKSGKPIISRNTGLPVFKHSTHNRLNTVKKELGLNTDKKTMTNEDRWKTIQMDIKINNY
jgi:hypothetical protein